MTRGPSGTAVPAVAVHEFGSVQPLPEGGDYMLQLRQALTKIATGRLAPVCPYDRIELEAVLQVSWRQPPPCEAHSWARPGERVLFHSMLALTSGQQLVRRLVLGGTPTSQALYWKVGILHPAIGPVWFGDERVAELAYGHMRFAGGGPFEDGIGGWTAVPPDDDEGWSMD